MTPEVYTTEKTNQNEIGPLTPEQQAKLDAFEDPDGAAKNPKLLTKQIAAKAILKDDPDVQRLILGMILAGGPELAAVRPTFKPDYFTQAAHQTIAKIVFRFYDKYRSGPSKSIVVNELGQQLAPDPDEKDQDKIKAKAEMKARYVAEVGACATYYVPGAAEAEYLKDKVNSFAQRVETKLAMAEYINARDEGKEDRKAFAAKLIEIEKIGTKSDDAPRALKIPDLAKLPPIEWQVFGHFPAEGFVCLYGPFGTGKSFFALDLALSIATGRQFLGRNRTKQGAVCYVAAEGYRGMYPRILAWMQAHGVTEPPDNFVLLPDTYDLQGNPTAGADIAELAKSALGEYPSLIVIDTLARMFGGGDENSTKDMNQYVANVAGMGKLCRATTLSVHHSGKDFTRGARGAVSLGAACDAMIELSGDVKEKIEAKMVKQKDAPALTAYLLQAKTVALDTAGPDGIALGDGSLALEYAGEKIVEDAKQTAQDSADKHAAEEFALLIRLPEYTADSTDGVSQAQLVEQLQWDQPRVSRVVQRLSKDGRIKTGKGPKPQAGRTPIAFYRSPESKD